AFVPLRYRLTPDALATVMFPDEPELMMVTISPASPRPAGIVYVTADVLVFSMIPLRSRPALRFPLPLATRCLARRTRPSASEIVPVVYRLPELLHEKRIVPSYV